MLSLEQYQTAFKSYDIRGIRGKEIDADLGYYLGLGLGDYIREQSGDQATMMIGADTRPNNTQLINNTLLGLSQSGLSNFVSAGMECDGYPHGICSTAMAYQLSYQTYDYSIIFSASHNSAEYIGIKIFTRENKFIPTSVLKKLFTKAFEKYSVQGFTPLSDTQAIDLYKQDSHIEVNKKKRSDMLDHYFGQLTKSHSFAIDYGHGAAVAYEMEYITQSPILRNRDRFHIQHLFGSPDGNFPAHETDTSRFSNYEKLSQEIQNNDKEFGFMFDGDADRLGIVLKNGTVMTGDILTAIVAKQALTNGMGDTFGSKKIFYEVFSSQVVKQVAAQYGGESTMVRVGRGAFCEQVIAEHGLIAGESSAHILFGPYGYAEIPLLALALILKESENFASFNEMAAHYMSTYKSQVYHFAIADKDGLMQHIDDSYPELSKNYVDGVRIDGDGFWFTVRKSGTEDIVKVAGEATDTAQFEKEWTKLKQIILEYGAHEK
ncbi:Phosphomannomutase/phosphoglucomutase [candidate division SR1 bacterium Aalborg_AAW-1]|nr:Phosphomannomutase/phosphoglucomutase [candidate division SR1 bacterium Aalborg_AAW-1]